MVQVTEEMKAAFDELIAEAQEQVKEHPDKEMVIVTQSAKGKRYVGFIHEVLNGDSDADTDAFVPMLIYGITDSVTEISTLTTSVLFIENKGLPAAAICPNVPFLDAT